MLGSVQIKEGAASKRGVKNEIATGELILNKGEKKFQAVSQDGVTRSITAQVRALKQGPGERGEGDADWQASGV